MNIFISANDKFIYPAKVMLTSFLVNNTREPHHIYFMHSSVQQKNIDSLDQLVTSFGSRFSAVQITADDFRIFPRTERFTIEVYYRFLVPMILPESETRAMWMDVDLVVNSALDEFYYQDLEDNCFAACQDIGMHDRYVNAGVICFNIPQMRQYRLEDYRDYYLAHKEEIVWQDQDILNGMFAGRIKVWDFIRWNVQFRPHPRLSRSQLAHLRDHAAVIHYIGACKPWHLKYTNSTAQLWDHYHTLACHYPPFAASAYILSRRLQRFCLYQGNELRKYIRDHLAKRSA